MRDAYLWVGFVALVVSLVVVDLVVSRRRHAALPVHAALGWSALWIGVSIAFGIGVWWVRGPITGLEFFTGYLIEKSLSVDNLFVFLIIFSEFRVPREQQHRVLTWGILGALVLRGVMILAGIQLIRRYHAVIYVFGSLLVFTGVRTLLERESRRSALVHRLTDLLSRILPIVPRYEGEHFVTREGGRRRGTMLLLVLLVVEATDAIFAIDSIPAIFAITRDPFIVFSSNILALLGLRALFFALEGLLRRLRFLRYGLGVLLLVIGLKMLTSDLLTIPVLWSLALTVAILAVTVAASLLAPGRPEPPA